MQEWVDKQLNHLHKAERALTVVAFVIMASALIIDVVGREIFNHGVFGSVKFAVYVLIYCAMAGFGIATATGTHLRPKIADGWFPAAWDTTIVRLGQWASAALLFGISWAGFVFIESSIMLEERSAVLDWLLWPFQLALPIGFALSALRHFCFGCWPSLIPTTDGAAP